MALSSVGALVIPGTVTGTDGVAYTVTGIGEDSFSYCTKVTDVTIPNNVNSIGGDAFAQCSGLTSITIPDSVNSIENDAFSECSSLTSVTIPDSVNSIGNYVFQGCKSLTSAKFERATAPTMGSSVFYNVPDGLKILIPHTNSGYLSGNESNGWVTYAPLIVTVTGVTVAPAATMVIPGNTQQFTATVEGQNNPLQTVTWTISGQSSASTTISTDGLLTVAADETATSLTVTATSTTTKAPAKTGTATVQLGKPRRH